MPQAQTFSSRQSEPTAQMTGEEKVWVAEGSLGLVRAVRATYFFARITAFFTGDAVGCQKTVMLFSLRRCNYSTGSESPKVSTYIIWARRRRRQGGGRRKEQGLGRQVVHRPRHVAAPLIILAGLLRSYVMSHDKTCDAGHAPVRNV